jgi:hypothetical protein
VLKDSIVSISVLQYDNVFSSERLHYTVEEGKTYAELLAPNIKNALVFCDGVAVPQDRWNTRPLDGTFVLIRVVPEGLVVAVFAIIFAAAVGTIVVVTLVNAITSWLRVDKTHDFESLPGVKGAGNSVKKWGAIPVILGKHYIAPIYAGSPYTEVAGDDGIDQYVHLSFVLGYGPLRVTDVRVGENLLASNSSDPVDNGDLVIDGIFDAAGQEVYVNLQQGAANKDTAMPYYPARVVEDQFSMEMKRPAAGPVYLYRTTPLRVTSFSVDMEYPQGLASYGDDGGLSSATSSFDIDYRAIGSPTWVSLSHVSLTKALARTLRYTYSSGALTAGQYEVRITKTSADSTDGKVRDTVNWTCLRSALPTPVIAADVCARVVRMSIRAKASSVLNGSVAQLNCVVQALIPMWDGEGSGEAHWAEQTLTLTPIQANPAAQALYMLRSGGPNATAFADADIDWPAFETLYTSCQEAMTPLDECRYECNAVMDTQITLSDALSKILSNARASFVLRGRKATVIQDGIKTVPVAVITPRNSSNFQGTKAFAEIPHGYRIKYINKDAGYQADERIVLADGYKYDTLNDGVLRNAFHTTLTTEVLATKLESIERWGITSPTEAFRMGRYLLAKQYLRPEVYSIKQSAQQLAYDRGDLVQLGYDIPLSGVTGGRVKSVGTSGGYVVTVGVDELLTMVDGTSYAIRYQKNAGPVVFAPIDTEEGTGYTVTLTTPILIADGPGVDDIFWFGVSGTETKACIVVGIEPESDLSATVLLQDYSPAIFDADEGTIPAYYAGITQLVVPDLANLGKDQATASDALAAKALEIVSTAVLITSSVSVFYRNRAGTLVPSTVTFNAALSSGLPYSGIFKVYETIDGHAFELKYTSASQESTVEYSPTSTAINVRVSIEAAP